MPVAQILKANLPGKVSAEHNHPVLTIAGSSGRPPQLDFVVKDKKPILVVETKWADVSAVDVVWDCVRLELAANHYGCDAVFILAGTRAQIDAVLSSSAFEAASASGGKSSLLHLHGRGHYSVKLQSSKGSLNEGLHEKFSKYPSVEWPHAVIWGHGTQVPKAASASQYTAAVWHIRPQIKGGKRHAFLIDAAVVAAKKQAKVATRVARKAAAKTPTKAPTRAVKGSGLLLKPAATKAAG